MVSEEPLSSAKSCSDRGDKPPLLVVLADLPRRVTIVDDTLYVCPLIYGEAVAS